MEEFNLFGEKIIKTKFLRDNFIEPPFTLLDTKGGKWQLRKKKWLSLGIKSEVGRTAVSFRTMDWVEKNGRGNINLKSNTSIFDPVLCELMYMWFCKEGGRILDPFAGGSVRGIVANYLGFKYTGIDIRQEQIDSNREQSIKILDINNQPQWYVGDSNLLLDDKWNIEFDLVFSCPPYADLEVYSDLDGDISNMPYSDFLKMYESIIIKSLKLLKIGGFAIFVVGEVRDKMGNYLGFVPDTIQIFKNAGMSYYNEAILCQSNMAIAGMRASGNMKSKKLVKVHQNVLVFKK